MSSLRALLVFLLLAALLNGSLFTLASAAVPTRMAGDVRISIASEQRRARDNTNKTVTLPALRVREGGYFAIDSRLELGVRLAGLIDRNTDHLEFHLDDAASAGNFSLDSLYLHYTPSNKLSLQLGRFQTAYELDSVIEDSLSRHDSSGMAVDWTDGLQLTLGTNDALRLHYIAQLNRQRGSSNGVGRRGPVEFSQHAARVTHYLALQFQPASGVTQFITDVTIIPSALHSTGFATAATHDLIAWSLRGGADIPLPQGFILHPALEVGATRVTPSKAAMGLAGGMATTHGYAWVAGLDVKQPGKGAWGLQWARTAAGYLMSPDYPPNTHSVELRYSLPITRNMKMDLRYRLRQDLEKPLGAITRKLDRNLLWRLTVKF